MNGKKTMKKCLSVFLTLAFVMSGLLPLGLTARAEETNTSDNWSSHDNRRAADGVEQPKCPGHSLRPLYADGG